MYVIHGPGLPRGFSFDPDDPGAACEVGPAALLFGAAARSAVENGSALPLCAGPAAFAAGTVYLCDGRRLVIATAPLDEIAAWADHEGGALARRIPERLDALTGPRPAFAGLPADRPVVFGIVNATPDSFSDGGRYDDPAHAIEFGRTLIEAGADALDIGGESTRPGADPVAEHVELARVLPVIEGLAGSGVPLSVDTRHAAVMEAALDAGARIVNDVSALTADPRALPLVAERRAPVILMHMKGEPATMNRSPRYAHAPFEVLAWLKARVAACLEAGVSPADIAVDPGFGFGKTAAHNRWLLAEIGLLHATGRPIMAGASRKFGGGGASGATDRLGQSVAAASLAAVSGVRLFRVHDVAETGRALDLIDRALKGV